ncbi:MAG: hypothetical protein IT306_00650 [Chloroflexi bacterium]|nr:hypothetical protein [Chloroflexota bacterium]
MEQPDVLHDVRVVHFGLGSLGAAIARVVVQREGLASVAAIDASPAREGRDLGEVAGLGRSIGVTVDGNSSTLSDIEADVVLYVPDGDLDTAVTDLELLLEVSLNVVAVVPELAYPPDDDEDDVAASIDTLAREAEVSVLALDPNDAVFGTLPHVLTGVCSSVDRITIRRIGGSAATGRLSIADWARELAVAMGWTLDDFDESEVTPGGEHHFIGSVGGVEVLNIELRPGPDARRVEIVVEGTPSLTLTLTGGSDDEDALASLAVNAIPAALTSDPGLFIMSDLAPIHAWTQLGLMPADDDDDLDDDE